jgi:catechol 2,3-dioxygenase-like lactoylglutathione lyase family enzyme
MDEEIVMLGVWHFSLTVSDLQRSIASYKKLGLELLLVQEQANAYTSRLVGYENGHLKVAQFIIPGQPRGVSSHDLELVEYVHPKGRRQKPDSCDPGEARLALTVTDIHSRYEQLKADGVHFFSPPNAITAGVNQGRYTCYFWDPDRIVLEMVQPPLSD